MAEIYRIHQLGDDCPQNRRHRAWIEFGITHALGQGLFMQILADRDGDEEEIVASIFTAHGPVMRCTAATLSGGTLADRRLVVRAVDRARARVLIEFQDQAGVPAETNSSA